MDLGYAYNENCNNIHFIEFDVTSMFLSLDSEYNLPAAAAKLRKVFNKSNLNMYTFVSSVAMQSDIYIFVSCL